jgi:hypothetical protein
MYMYVCIWDKRRVHTQRISTGHGSCSIIYLRDISKFWKIKMNKQIYDKFKSPDIATVTTVHSLEWLRYVVRMDGERTVQKLLEGKPGGGRKK